MSISEYNFPEDLKKMTAWELTLLCDEIRDFLLENVSKTGGHLASNLGVVELTTALHAVFDSPTDRILWDVGHQSYVHKILTGRADDFSGLRQYGGLSGFPKRSESPHDVYDAGHSSDSISIGLGIAEARDRQGEDFNVVTVIGDGALTGGVAYEALNNAGASKSKMIIIINDNQMSISSNVGGMTQHLTRLRMSPGYNSLKDRVRAMSSKNVLSNLLYRGLGKIRDGIKTTLIKGNSVFDNLGFKSYGPFNGHDIVELIEAFEGAKRIDGSVVLHVVTKKGKGVEVIENMPEKFHGIGPFNLKTFEPLSKPDGKSWSDVFSNKLMEMALRDDRITAICPAMVSGTGLSEMFAEMPDRIVDVGIAEQHAVSYATGLALGGMRPFISVYSTFLQRAYDEIVTNVCLQNLPVVFCIDRAGNVGQDGETHNGQFDLSYLSHMPNMTVMVPYDDRELRDMMEYALQLGTPCAIRYPRGTAIESDGRFSTPITTGCEVLRKGTKSAIIAVGKYVDNALRAAEILQRARIETTVINARFVKPLDEQGLRRACGQASVIITLEDNVVSGGLGAAVNASFVKGIRRPRIINLGWPDEFIRCGKTEMLEEVYGLDPLSIANRIKYEL